MFSVCALVAQGISVDDVKGHRSEDGRDESGKFCWKSTVEQSIPFEGERYPPALLAMTGR